MSTDLIFDKAEELKGFDGWISVSDIHITLQFKTQESLDAAMKFFEAEGHKVNSPAPM